MQGLSARRCRQRPLHQQRDSGSLQDSAREPIARQRRDDADHRQATSLDRGNGVCKYLNGNLCSIYENRPVICCIDESYKLFFKQFMSLDEYYERNYAACHELKKTLTK